MSRRTHEEHVDLVGQQAQLAGNGKQHKGKLPDLSHAQAHRQSRACRILEHVHYHANLHVTGAMSVVPLSLHNRCA